MNQPEPCPYTEADIGWTFDVPVLGAGVLLDLRAINGLGDRAVTTERTAAIDAVFRTSEGGYFTVRYGPRVDGEGAVSAGPVVTGEQGREHRSIGNVL